MSDCSTPVCDPRKEAFEACLRTESVSFDGLKYFLSGAIVGSALTLLVPRSRPLFQRQLPFMGLGVAGRYAASI